MDFCPMFIMFISMDRNNARRAAANFPTDCVLHMVHFDSFSINIVILVTSIGGKTYFKKSILQ